MMTAPTIVYVGDPMCSWCWGAAPQIDKLKESNPGLGFRIILGGLRPYHKEKLSVSMGQFLRKHWEEIAAMTGQPFSFDILQNRDFIYHTEAPCRAVWVARQINPEKAFDFFKAIQKAFYFHNFDTNAIDTYLRICEQMALDTNQFQSLYLSEEAREKTEEEFEKARMLGVSGFPTLLLQWGETYKMLARGYENYEKMQGTLNLWLHKFKVSY